MSDCECGRVFPADAELCAECAADEIERLRDENGHLRAEVERLSLLVGELVEATDHIGSEVYVL